MRDGNIPEFLKRTNKGNEYMAHEEIKTTFLGFYEKRLKLNLLSSELQTIAESASGMVQSDADKGQQYSLVTFDTNILESILADTFTILSEENNLLSSLTIIRKKCKIVNNKMKAFYSEIALPIRADVIALKYTMTGLSHMLSK